MNIHELKCWPVPFEATLDGLKRSEYRRDDRGGFERGDLIWLREYLPNERQAKIWAADHDMGDSVIGYTGRSLLAEIEDVQRDEYGIPEGYAVLSIKPLLRHAGHGGWGRLGGR